ncbi:TrkH family potassium uptake protein [bacterium]|nr:TrkH family potassium uptake protein [candidate division CSSED10-310 bacterium]
MMKRKRFFAHIDPVAKYVGGMCLIFAFVVLCPIMVPFLFDLPFVPGIDLLPFALSSLASFSLGAILIRKPCFPAVNQRQAMLICVFSWIAISFLAAIPFYHHLHISFLDALFEAVSGLTTTGTTVLARLEHLPPSLLFWRSLTQWLGGLGILAFFMALLYQSGAGHFLIGAESHKAAAKRVTPGLFKTLVILWGIYLAFTLLFIIVFYLEGMLMYDAVNHALTTISTGGFSPYDASLDYLRQEHHPNFKLIEITAALFMILGGTNFLIHFRVLRGEWRALWDTSEVRTWWGLIAAATAAVTLETMLKGSGIGPAEAVRNALFVTASLFSSTGYTTVDFNSGYFLAVSRQVFIMIMLVGGCVGSTGGGLKVYRLVILAKLLRRQLENLIFPRQAVHPLLIDGDRLESEELQRVSAMFFAWILLIAGGGVITAMFSQLDAWQAFSGVFSALGNMGPSFIPVDQVVHLHPVVKLVFIVNMLAGRLEILPLLIVFTKRAWR